MCNVCDDNRFKLIEKYKTQLIEATNIADSPEEMAVLDTIFFRFWQMDWLDKLEKPAQQWIPCSERLPEELVPVNVTWVNKDPNPYYLMIKDKPFTDTAVYYNGKWYWQSALCIDMLKEYGESPADDVAYGIEIVAWMPLPERYKGGEKCD